MPTRCGFNVLWVYLFAQITFQNQVGKFDLEVTAFQMAVLFTWNQRPEERLSFEDIRYDAMGGIKIYACVSKFDG